MDIERIQDMCVQVNSLASELEDELQVGIAEDNARELALVRTKLEEAAMWLEAAEFRQ